MWIPPRPSEVSAGGLELSAGMICLDRGKLAGTTMPLDDEIPASRSGREEIKWSQELLSAFKDTQKILLNPMAVTIPRANDIPLVVTDACTTLPAGGARLILQRPGAQGYSHEFPHIRLPPTSHL